jgi:hypothetical protein
MSNNNMSSRISAMEKRISELETYAVAVDETMQDMVSIMLDFEERQKYLAGANVLGRFDKLNLPRARANRRKERENSGNGNRRTNSGNGNRRANSGNGNRRTNSGNGNSR